MKLSHVRLGVRMARRELRRRPWRTVLVLLMVLVPSVAMTLVVVTMRTGDWDSADKLRAQYGEADLAAWSDSPTDAEVERLLDALPPGTRAQTSRLAFDRIRTGSDRTYIDVSDLRLDDPIARGRFGPLSGRVPRTGGEVALTTELAHDLHAGIGDRFRLDGLERDVRVVGIVRPNSNEQTAYIGARLDPSATGPGSGSVVFDLPGGVEPEQVAESATVPGWNLHPLVDSVQDGTPQVFWAYVGGGVGLVILGTVITAAFAVGARRQLRTIGLLSASGAAPKTVKWFLVAQGAVAGFIGSVIGVGLAVLGMELLPQRVIEDIAQRPVAGPILRVGDLLPIVAIGVLVAAGASWIPARTAARVPTLQALAGRRPLPKVPRRLPLLGALSVGAGCALLAMAVAGSKGGGGAEAWALTAVVGGLAIVLGAIAVAPWVVAGLERGGGWLGGTWRLACRSLARNRVRSSAVIGAISAIAMLVVAGSALYASVDNGSDGVMPWLHQDEVLFEGVDQTSPPGQSWGLAMPRDLADRLRRVVPGARIIPLPTVTTAEGQATRSSQGLSIDFGIADPADGPVTAQRVTVASDALLDHIGLSERLRAALDRGEAVAFGVVPPGTTTIGLDVHAAQGARSLSLPLAGSFLGERPSQALSTVLIGPKVLQENGLVAVPSQSTLVALPALLSEAQLHALDVLQDDLTWEQDRTTKAMSIGPEASLFLPGSRPPLTEAEIKAIIWAAAALLVLAVVGVGLALAAQDDAEERQVLDAVGAPPRTLRGLSARRATLLAFIAGLISVPAGLLPAWTIIVAGSDTGSREWSFRPDVSGLLLVLVIVPAGAGLIVWIGGRLRALVRPTRPDVFAFGD